MLQVKPPYPTTDPQARRPLPGSVWAWEPHKPQAAALTQVVGCVWNGEEWWVESTTPRHYGLPSGSRVAYWNDLSRFWEACHAIARKAGPEPSGTRSGPPLPEERPLEGE